MPTDLNDRYAGFWIRLVADLIDTTILTILSWMIELMGLGVVYWASRSGLPFFDAFNSLMLQVLNIVIYGAIGIPYYVIGHFKYGTTLGKYPLKVYVVDHATRGPITLKQSWIRCLSYGLSYLPFSAGFIMAAYHPEKRALHDLIAGTVSVRRK